MSRLGPLPMTAHARWDDASVALFGWDGRTPASGGWLTGMGGLARSIGGFPIGLPTVMASLSRVVIPTDDRGPMVASCLRLGPDQAAPWFARMTFVPDDDLSPSLQWFRAIAELAEAVVDAGRIRPAIESVPSPHKGAQVPLTAARWRVVPGPDVDVVLDSLAAAAPPIALPLDLPPPGPAGAASQELPLAPSRRSATEAVLTAFVDGLARTRLGSTGWKPPLVGLRGPEVQAIRGVFTVLANRDRYVKQGNDAFQVALNALRHELDREVRRAAGEPVVEPRLRLVLPEESQAPWPVVLELVDESGAWCTGRDLAERNPMAVDVAGGEAHLAALDALVGRTALALTAEIPVLAGLARPGFDGQVLLDIDEVAELLQTAPEPLARLGVDLVGPEALVKANPSVRGAARPPGSERPGGLNTAAIVDWSVAVTAEDGSAAGAVTDEELQRARSAGVALLQVGGRWVQLDGSQLDKARRALETHREKHGEVDALTLLRLAADGHDDEVDTVLEGERDPLDALDAATGSIPGESPSLWIGDLLAGLPDESLSETHEPPSFVGELRHYQRRGLSWLQFLARVGLGGVLADDMGLGKTATTLAHLLTRPGPHLVVCPLSVVRNWQTETARFAPSLKVLVHHGADRTRGETTSDVLGDADLVVTTYGLIARDVTELAEVPWSTLVLDEAQFVKNPATRAARAVRHVPAGQKIALTGTPVENHLGELWAILDAVNPGMLGSNRRFRDRYARPIERDGDEEVAAKLRMLTQPFVLRRTKADKRLLPDLPDKVEQIAWATLTKEQIALYEKVVEQLIVDAQREEGMKRRGLVLAALTRLKQICNHPVHALGDNSRLSGRSGKLERFDELVDELLEADERALVFTQFREMGELLQRHLAERSGLAVPFLHGGVTRARRDAMVESFQAKRGAPLLLVSLKAGGTGLNLTAATRVIHYDRWWNPAVEDQASDRAWRIGQTQTVFVHKLVCAGTVEEKIAALIDDKKRLAEAVVGTGEAWLSELSTDELRDLVRLELEGQ